MVIEVKFGDEAVCGSFRLVTVCASSVSRELMWMVKQEGTVVFVVVVVVVWDQAILGRPQQHHLARFRDRTGRDIRPCQAHINPVRYPLFPLSIPSGGVKIVVFFSLRLRRWIVMDCDGCQSSQRAEIIHLRS